MHHAFIDTYADLDTPLHKIDARLKVILLVGFLLLIVLSPLKYILLFLLYILGVIALIYLSKVPVKFIFKRVIEIIPFIVVIAFSVLFREKGYILFLSCALKAILAMLLVLVILSTTKFTQLLGALRQLKTPKLVINLLSFMYRYLFLLEDQFLTTQSAYESRNINNRNDFIKVKVLSNILGTLFIRTYERAEKVYLAMCARGYNSEKSG
ncbi:MAG: cobalt ECF transporter T component CbiQ [Candidatus Omnitrophica bacterium]|nr:cobalt ECF transporter T component CbiQ [Candidatus Omnitrophota bacterium]